MFRGVRITAASAGVGAAVGAVLFLVLRFVVGPERQSYPLPQLPLKAIEDVPVKFNMVLTDVPGPHGTPRPDVEWAIVRADDEELAQWGDEKLLTGISTSDGKLALTDADEKLLHDEWNRTPGRLWLVSEGHAHQLVLSVDRDAWTPDQKAQQALDAMGYTDDLGRLGDESADVSQTALARRETNLKTGDALLNKIKT